MKMLSQKREMRMIENSRLEKIWKRTVIHLIAVMVVGLAILGSFVLTRIQTSSGPTFVQMAIVLLALLAGAVSLYSVAKAIKNEIGRWYGKN